MRVSKRQDNEIPEGESYYVSMTDMMVGVVFIFILLLSFFALQYHATTSALTKASDPQTTALLQMASNLQPKTVDLQIDYENKVVCIPTAALAKDDAAASTDKRCFAYSALAKASKASGPSADESREALTAFLKGDLASKIPVQADTANGTLTFTADDLFLPGSDALSPKGVTTASDVAQSLAGRLPCYGYGAPTGACASPSKMAAVNVAGDASFNAFSAEGQQAYDLALRRTVAFYKALIADQPILGQIKDGPLDGAQPLLRVASGGQSKAATASSTAEQSISIQFVMAS